MVKKILVGISIILVAIVLVMVLFGGKAYVFLTDGNARLGMICDTFAGKKGVTEYLNAKYGSDYKLKSWKLAISYNTTGTIEYNGMWEGVFTVDGKEYSVIGYPSENKYIDDCQGEAISAEIEAVVDGYLGDFFRENGVEYSISGGDARGNYFDLILSEENVGKIISEGYIKAIIIKTVDGRKGREFWECLALKCVSMQRELDIDELNVFQEDGNKEMMKIRDEKVWLIYDAQYLYRGISEEDIIKNICGS